MRFVALNYNYKKNKKNFASIQEKKRETNEETRERNKPKFLDDNIPD